MDSSKFGTSDFVTVCELGRIDMIITERTTDDVTRWCQDHDVTLRMVQE
jgi:DeoR/GlpR family transcriptional regulator of sugar metabolism